MSGILYIHVRTCTISLQYLLCTCSVYMYYSPSTADRHTRYMYTCNYGILHVLAIIRVPIVIVETIILSYYMYMYIYVILHVHLCHCHILMRDERRKEERHSTPNAITFPKKDELPRVGLEPTILYTLDRVLYH